ncbi:MAG: hypothetical protein Q4C85_07315 [Actinomyces sp.]|uniref:hypothetical protein n=1 Tax=Actinomyces sp. TaxID=29317 RepID=UPI0026DC6744|nr:hypothetical protein [Actinomyces sp.]MDO4243552.1 hypothetical protein [Actinomyces sp.]
MTNPLTLEACVAHALTRSGYTAGRVDEAVRTQWGTLPADSRHRILQAIRTHLKAPHRGREAARWHNLEAWGSRHLGDPTVGSPALEGTLLPAGVRAVLDGRAQEQAEHVWADLAQAWPQLMTATRQVVLACMADHDDPHLAAYAQADPVATRRVIRLLARTGRARQANRLQRLARGGCGQAGASVHHRR